MTRSEAGTPPPPWHIALAKRGVRSVAISVLFGVVLAAVRQQNLWITLIYTVTISIICWFCIDLGRLGVARIRQPPVVGSGADGKRDWPGWPWMVVIILLGSTVGFSLGTAIGDWITGLQSSNLYNQGNLRDALSLLLFALLPAVALTYFFYSRSVIADREASAQAARGQAAESRLKLLESQLEPHMLFNTLANLRALIGLDPPRAEAMLDQLIAYLRATLSASRLARQPLRAEFARLADYLALIQVRMADRVEPRFELPPELSEIDVPPLLLQPLVENAVKHGLEPSVRGGRIRISAAREGDDLLLSVRDTGVGLDAGRAERDTTAGAGFGLAQIRERLATLYGARASLRLESAVDADGGTLAVIRLPVGGPGA